MVNTAANLLISDTKIYHQTAPGAFFNALGGDFPRQYCRWFWKRPIEEGNKGLFSAIGTPKRTRKTVSTLAEFYLAASTDTDLFYTPNVFFDWRNARMTAGLCANYIEIDTVRNLTDLEKQNVLNDVLERISKNGLPYPTAIIESGSGGLHLYWIYDGMVEAYPMQRVIWKDIAEALSSSLLTTDESLWYVDIGASHDISRFLRIPGSKHSGSGARVKVWLNGDKYDFYQLADKLNITTTLRSVKPKRNNKEKITDRTVPLLTESKHSIFSWWGRIYFHIANHIRKIGTVPDGRRDSTAFIAFVALRRITSIEKSWALIKELNKNHIKLSERELERYLATASKTTYKYKKETLRGYLESIGIPVPDFLQGATIKWNVSLGLAKDEIAKRQRLAGHNTSSTRRAGTERLIENAILSVAAIQKGLPSCASIASYTKLSIRTVQRFFRACRDNRYSCISAPLRDLLHV
ncbi:hypothetical protein [Pectobacterium versatile]|uniref:hypothetical protein n=1 Tax=Pectobacterium versatile TaxID=2488639 RepID=UPI001F18772D|nr:hypothetical protein [Pectobacterium versatile]